MRRIQGTRVTCELQGCLDVDVRFGEFRVEDLMIKICGLIEEHKRHSEEQGLQCFNKLGNTINNSDGQTTHQILIMDANFEF